MDLSTTYMGLKLKNPLVPSSSPLMSKIDSVRAMEDAGAAAVVLHSLFEEQIRHEEEELDHYLTRDAESFQEAMSYFPDLGSYKLGPEEYLNHIRKIKEAVKIPVIASLNGVTNSGWIDYAKKSEQAGADAIELNVYFIVTNPKETGAEVEQRYIDILKAVKKSVRIPVAMKLGAFFSSIPNMATRLSDAGADGLVLFNRFYQPDIDLETKEVTPNVILSNSSSSRLPMRWIAILFGHVKCSLGATTGIHTHEDAIKMLMVGADVTMMTSALMKHGVWHLASVREAMGQWLDQHEYRSVAQLKGSLSQKNCAEPGVFERANYMKALASLG
jgi:dihydroorotate dehydrogenase (fumarate)